MSLALVDERGVALGVGRDDPLARARLVSVLRINSRELAGETVAGAGVLISPRVWVHRMVSAGRVANTRLL